jgi:biopolymer transport protein ExbB
MKRSMNLRMNRMNTSPLRAICAVIGLLAMASPSLAQQKMAPAPQPAPISSQPPVASQPSVTPQAVPPAPQAASPAQVASPVQAPAAASPAAAPVVAPLKASDAVATAADGDAGRSVKSTAATPHELSPWSMFMSADILVKAVMIGLAFASLVTWTVFIAKMIELSVIQRKLRAALIKIADARSLAEAQFALGAKGSVLSALLAAAMREARLSAGISSDSGIKERAASSFAEIVRAESRRIRLGMGLLATIGATSPFVGLFGTVWGIMNSFIGISKSQTTNLAVVAPGIAEALLATAMGLVAAIPAVIIYNHFARVTKGYLELVGRSSGAAGRLLSRDLDRTHVSSLGSTHSRAAE